MNAQSKIDEAKAAADQNNRELAWTILKDVIQQDPQNTQAWVAMADVVDNPNHAILCLERVLKLEPNNDTARQKLNELRDPPVDFSTSSSMGDEQEPEILPQSSDDFETSQIEAHQPQPSVHYETPQAGTQKPEHLVRSTPPPYKSQPKRSQGASARPKKRSKQSPKKSGRWLEIFLLVIIVMCLCVVGMLAISQFTPSSALQAGPTPTLEDVRAVIYKNMNAANEEDLDRYMDTIHPKAPGRFLTRNAMQGLFDKYDLHYKVSGLKVVEVTDNEARVSFALTTRKINGPPFRDNWLSGVMILRLDDRVWKIYDQEVTDVTYLD